MSALPPLRVGLNGNDFGRDEINKPDWHLLRPGLPAKVLRIDQAFAFGLLRLRIEG